jgi:hypothetical protein
MTLWWLIRPLLWNGKSYMKIVVKYFNLYQFHLAYTWNCIFNLSGESISLLHFKIEFFSQIFLTVLFDGFWYIMLQRVINNSSFGLTTYNILMFSTWFSLVCGLRGNISCNMSCYNELSKTMATGWTLPNTCHKLHWTVLIDLNSANHMSWDFG